jgi:hypothetical protein
VEAGIGRLLTSEERREWPSGTLRTAFAIGCGRALTAWHCVRDVGGEQAHLWLRLQSRKSSQAYTDVPMRYENHLANLDIAVLIVDDGYQAASEDSLSVSDLRRCLDSVALPLGVSVEPLDIVRIAGFPQENPADWCVMFSGKVTQVDASIGHAAATRLFIDELAARYPESPKGMSGGPVLRKYSDGKERVVAVLSIFPPGQKPGTALGGEFLCRRIAHTVMEFHAVAEVLKTAEAEDNPTKGIWTDPTTLTLSLDVRETYRHVFSSDANLSEAPVSWALDELSRIREDSAACGRSKAVDTLTALCRALVAKQVFLALGGSRLGLGQLQVVYRCEIGAWPDGRSADALLVEAASVGIAERQSSDPHPLGALVRFMVGVAAALGVLPREGDPMARWIAFLGHQLRDVQDHYRERWDSPAWLFIDLGDEPRPKISPWPTTVTWTKVTADDEVVWDSISCQPTPEACAGRRSTTGGLEWDLHRRSCCPSCTYGPGNRALANPNGGWRAGATERQL